MSPEGHPPAIPRGSADDGAAHACAACLARSVLLASLSARIEHAAVDAGRLLDLLRLPDEQLIAAIGGRRREELGERHRIVLAEMRRSPTPSTLCMHLPLHRQIFGGRLDAAAALHVDGSTERLRGIFAAPIVAIVGAAQASDYGMEMAAALARALARCGVGVAACLGGGVAAAAHRGTLEAGAAPLAVMAGGADVCKPACLRELHRRIRGQGTTISELPEGFRPRRWSERSAERVLAALAQLVIVIETDSSGAGLLAAELASQHGAAVAALPGRVTSPRSRGPHSLLRRGAALVASPQDALDLLYGLDAPAAEDPCASLDEGALSVIERIGAGDETLGSLSSGPERAATLSALGELRRRGLIARGDGGRYLPRVSLDHHGMASVASVDGNKRDDGVDSQLVQRQPHREPNRSDVSGHTLSCVPMAKSARVGRGPWR